MPADFRHFIEPQSARFMTSLDGETARIYSVEDWNRLTAELNNKGEQGEQIAFIAANFGRLVAIDSEGRMLTPAEWKRRRSAAPFRVWLFWNQDHILVLTEEQYQARMARLDSNIVKKEGEES